MRGEKGRGKGKRKRTCSQFLKRLGDGEIDLNELDNLISRLNFNKSETLKAQ